MFEWIPAVDMKGGKCVRLQERVASRSMQLFAEELLASGVSSGGIRKVYAADWLPDPAHGDG